MTIDDQTNQDKGKEGCEAKGVHQHHDVDKTQEDIHQILDNESPNSKQKETQQTRQPCMPIIKGIIDEIEEEQHSTKEQLDIINSLKKFGIVIDERSRQHKCLKLLDEKYLIEIFEIIKINNNLSLNEYNYTEEELEIYNYYKKGRTIKNIIQALEELTKENRNIKAEDIIAKIRPDLLTLPINEAIEIILTISFMVQVFNNIRKYMNFEKGQYKNSIELFQGYLDSDWKLYREFDKLLNKVKNEEEGDILDTNIITAEQHGISIAYICDERLIPKKIGLKNNKFCISTRTNNRFIEGSFTVIVNKKRYYNLPESERNKHFNFSILTGPIQYFDPERHNDIYNEQFQLLLSYLKSGITTEQIKRRIRKNVTFMYPKIKDIRKRYQLIKHIDEILLKVEKYINLIENSNLGLTKESIIDMLFITPLNKLDEICSNINKFSTNNSEIWWTGSDKKESVIEDIENCNSIHEVKHILNNPKFSHIGRTSDNKGGIEISAIIDSIIAGDTPITCIPTEIKQKIEELIKKEKIN